MSLLNFIPFAILILTIANYLTLHTAYYKWYRRKIEYQLEALARDENINKEANPWEPILMISYLLVAFSIVLFVFF